MRVAHLTTVDLSLRHLLWAQLLGARRAGHHAEGISAPGPSVAELNAAGIPHWPLVSSTRGPHLRADLRSARELWQLLRREQVDVLHTHNPKPGVYGRIVGRLAGVPLVVNTVHGLYATRDDPLPKQLVVYALEAVASRFSHAELVQNPEDLELLTAWRLHPRGRSRLLGNGVDLARFRPGSVEERDEVRRELGVAPDDVVVGTVGRLVAEKGYPELFEAAARLRGRVVLVVVGPDDPDKPDALGPGPRQRARQAGVRFLGMRDDVDRLYRGMDLFVLPSHREGFPRAAMEAAASGLPVVATDIRGCRQVVDAGVTGRLVPVRSPDRLAAAIQGLVDDADLRRRLGEAGRRRAEEHFDEDAVVRIVLDTYERLLPVPPTAADRAARRRGYAAAKRVIDLVGAGVGLVALSPVLAAAALAVRARLGRPVLFVQERPGRYGRPFRVLKLRTMTESRGADGELLPDEQRLTALGRFLRSTSLDELPELVNVLRGEMSLVGPRPLLPEYLPRYDADQVRRHAVRPGLTGWAQVAGRNQVGWQERLALDTWYVDHASLGLDVRILARTLVQVLRRQGIAHLDHATMPAFEGSGRGPHPSEPERDGKEVSWSDS